MKQIVCAVLLVLALSGCYHTTVITGQPYDGASRVVEKKWHLTFVYGLIPGSDIDVSEECVQGVAKVETKHSFLNQLAGGLSGGIITPLSVKVTCANGPRI